MELFRRKLEITEDNTPVCEDVVEIFDQQVNEDATRLNYSVRRRGGRVLHFAIPRGALNVVFTTQGAVELPPDTDENH